MMARVLVVDDDVTVREVVVSYLKAAGHQAYEAADGSAALSQFREQSADLVILDLMMPGVDGLQVCARLRAMSDVPIVMLTALGAETDRVGASGQRPAAPRRGPVRRVAGAASRR